MQNHRLLQFEEEEALSYQIIVGLTNNVLYSQSTETIRIAYHNDE